MRKAALIVLVLAAFVFGAAVEKLKFPWAGADWNPEVTMTKLELEARNWNSSEPWVVIQSGGKPTWTCEGVEVSANPEGLRLAVKALPHWKVQPHQVAQSAKHFCDYFIPAWKNRSGVPKSWPMKVDIIMGGKVVHSESHNVK